MKEIFPESNKPYNLRNNNPFFHTSNMHSVDKGIETVSFRGPKLGL